MVVLQLKNMPTTVVIVMLCLVMTDRDDGDGDGGDDDRDDSSPSAASDLELSSGPRDRGLEVWGLPRVHVPKWYMLWPGSSPYLDWYFGAKVCTIGVRAPPSSKSCFLCQRCPHGAIAPVDTPARRAPSQLFV